MKIKNLILILIFGAFLLPSSLHALTSKDIEEDIMCICKDNCGKVLGNCTCGQSDLYRKEIMAMITEGKTKKDIIDHYVGRFGEKVLASPTKSGFNLTAWILPFLAIFAGGWGINKVVQSWVKKRRDATLTEKSSQGDSHTPTGEDPYKKLMDHELKEYDS